MIRLSHLAISWSLLGTAACAAAHVPVSTSATSANTSPSYAVDEMNHRSELRCTGCDAIPIPTEITRAVETRISDLKTRGGDCQRIGTVLESSLRAGQITLRPFMWRVGAHLASGEAKPNGDMVLAREIDSLNVGVRTVDDVIWTMEHEAAHIAFDFASGNEASEEKANQTVRSCKA